MFERGGALGQTWGGQPQVYYTLTLIQPKTWGGVRAHRAPQVTSSLVDSSYLWHRVYVDQLGLTQDCIEHINMM